MVGMENKSTVKCADCGYLTILQKHPDRALAEVDREIRKTGDPPVKHHQGQEFENWPLCFVHRYELKHEFDEANEQSRQNSRQQNFLAVINLPRNCEPVDCKGFVEWKQGFTPKEHYEMMLSAEMLAIQHRREDDDRKWRGDESKKNRKANAVESKRNRKANKQNSRIAVFGAVGAAIVGSIVGVIAGAVWKSKEPIVIELKPPAATAAAMPTPAATAPATPTKPAP